MSEKFDPRKAEPGQVFTYTDAEGKQVNLRANAEGVVEPRNDTERVLLDGFGLSVARKAEEPKKKEGE